MYHGPTIQPARATKNSTLQRSSTEQSLFMRLPLKEMGSKQNLLETAKQRVMSKELLKPTIVRSNPPSNPLYCQEYTREINNYLRDAEKNLLPPNQIFENQTNLTPKMRATLIDWLVEVQKKKKFHTDTLFFAVNYIDRYLIERDIDKSKFQLLGSAAMLLASKTEEIHPVSCHSMVHLSGESFSVNALCRMESALFSTLDYNVTPVVSSHFLKRYLLCAGGSSKFTIFAYYVNETLLLDSDFIDLKPSLVAAGVIAFSMAVIKDAPVWSKELQAETMYSLTELKPVVSKIHSSVLSIAASRFQAIRKKYASQDNECVSTIEIPKELRF